MKDSQCSKVAALVANLNPGDSITPPDDIKPSTIRVSLHFIAKRNGAKYSFRKGAIIRVC